MESGAERRAVSSNRNRGCAVLAGAARAPTIPPMDRRSNLLCVALLALLAAKCDDPAPAPAPGPASRPAESEAMARHVDALRARLPGPGFTIVVEAPFVVVGDEAPATVRMRAEKTVRWAADKLRAEYFEKDPAHILDVWLFKDETSYRANAKKLFDDEPSTPFGYYAATHRALVMNIATGGGTLVHEIVHPFLEANFPGCPAWFNEGLASLYEQSAERGGRIRGLTNWRLAGLQEALRAKRAPSFEALLATTSAAFYGDDKGTNYAQARYLLYYLQEKDLLRRYYREFLAARRDDPSGVSTLRRVLDTEDLAAFQKTWADFVLALRFP